MDYDSGSSEIIADSVPGELSEIHVSADASEIGDGSSQKPFKSLEGAINNSKNGAIIYLNDGEYVGENNRNIEIDKSITIIGESKQNTIINGESCGRLFNVTSTGKLTLINITLLNGYSTEDGGVIYCNGGEINIKNCIFKDSAVDGNGGVIYNNLGSLNIEDSSFINNKAFRYGGVLYTLGKTSIKNSNFTENALTSVRGVGACIAAGGKLDLDGCLFYNCYSPYSAGAILSLANATINNCRFERLYTDYTAGAISNHNYMIINNSYFGYNEVKYYAGAILAPPSGQHVTTIVYNSIFEKNHAGYHAAVSNNFKDTELYMQNCALIDNYLKLDEIYGDIALDDNATIQYCWWGKNVINPYYYSPHSGEIEPEKINASRWLVMTFTSNNDVIYRNEVNQLTVSLKYYFDNETKEIYEYDGEFDLPLDVTFYTSTGTLATKKLVNGVATFDYNPQKKDSVVYAKINNQILKIDDFQLRKTDIIADDLEKYYGNSSDLVIKLIKDNNAPISNEQLKVSLAGRLYTIKTDENGQAKLSIDGLTPNVYNATITFTGGGKYLRSTKSVNVVVKKATPKWTAIEKAFEDTDKTKNYTATLKDDGDNAIKNVAVTFEVNGETYNATTDSNGVATFNLENLTSVGNFTATLSYPGDDNYNNATANAKITVESASKTSSEDSKENEISKAKTTVESASKTTSKGSKDKAIAKAKTTVRTAWKTISKGSKESDIVKKIQIALKKNGYYLEFNGHYLKVDGIYGNFTENAVKEFQKANGLNVTGKVDYETAQKLGLVE